MWGPNEFAQFTEDELHKTMMESEPGSNHFEWAKAELQHRDRQAGKDSGLTPSQKKAATLLRLIYDETRDKSSPIDDVTKLHAGLAREEIIASFNYLKNKGLIQTFRIPYAARINAYGIDAVEGKFPSVGQSQPAEPEQSMPHVKLDSSRTAIPRKVFIVHGHDVGVREAVARFVEKIGLEAIILHEQANKGQTIIEKVETNGDVGFAIVLLTPDDVGCKAGDNPQPRPRQNVLVELGYFIGRLGRDHVCALATSGTMELPTDFAGVVWEPFDSGGGWKTVLGRELRAAGFLIDFNKAI